MRNRSIGCNYTGKGKLQLMYTVEKRYVTVVPPKCIPRQYNRGHKKCSYKDWDLQEMKIPGSSIIISIVIHNFLLKNQVVYRQP